MNPPSSDSPCCTPCASATGATDLPESPVGTTNIAGRSRLRYRAGVHGTFKEAMLESAAASEGLRAHTSRGDESGAVALMDTCAVMLDVVTFYTEVLANEGYLPTAVERRSVLEMARSIGYELKPGVAASTRLAFEVQIAPGMAETVEVPTGTQVQSLPQGQELPLTFETTEPITAYPAWNRFAPRLTRPQVWTAGKTTISLAGTGLGLRLSGRLVLLFAPVGGAFQVATIANLAEDYDRKVTQVTLNRPLDAIPSPLPAGYPKVVAFAARAGAFGAAAPNWKSLPAASKREILGLAEGAEIPPEDRAEWPDFNIHLPGGVSSRFASPDALALVTSPATVTAESIVQRVRSHVTRYVDTVDTAFRTQASTAGFAAGGAGVRGLDLVGGTVRTTAQALGTVLAAVGTDIANAPQALATPLVDVLQTLAQGLQQLLSLDFELPNQVDTSLEGIVNGLRGLVDSLRDARLTAGSVTAFGTRLETKAGEVFAAFLRGHPIAVLDRVAGEIGRLLASSNLPERTRNTASAFLASLGEFRSLAQGAIRLGLARQAQVIVDTALQTALAQAKPAQFRSRRGFVTFAAATLAKVVAFPATLGPGSSAFLDLLAGRSSPTNLEDHLDPELYENFDAARFASEDGLAVSDAEVALAAVVIGSDPRIAMSYAALAGLLQAENLAQQVSDSGVLPIALPGGGTTTASAVQQTSFELQDTILRALATPAPVAASTPYAPTQAHDFTQYGAHTDTVSLDQEYTEVLPGSLVCLDDPAGTTLQEVRAVETVSRSSFSLSGKSTIVHATASALAPFRQAVRTLTVYAASRELPLAEEIDPTPVTGDTLLVSTTLPEPPLGHRLALEGLDATTAAPAAELLEVFAVTPVPALAAWRLTLAHPLTRAYRRDSVVLRGNLAPATHGASRSQILGHGDARLRFPTFTLGQSPLTHVSSATEPGGAASTLQVRVDGIEWKRADSFYQRDSREEIYHLRLRDDGASVVRFGDGVTGSRLPTGINNITASFRIGLGAAGNLPSGRLTSLGSRPLGLTGVAHPLPATGGEDPESLDDARANAPLTVLTLDRLVSLRDYADYARAFAGIAKARSAWAWFGEAQGVLLTVAGPDGAAVTPGEPTFDNLLASMDRQRDRAVAVRVVSHAPRPFALAARLRLDDRVEPEPVLEAARALLLDAFAFARRDLGQAVTSSEVLALLHTLKEVLGVDLDALHFVGATPSLQPRLVAHAGSVRADGVILPAEMLTLDPGSLTLGILNPA